jgi:hypothetical protein
MAGALAGGLAADIWTDLPGQLVVSACVWGLLLYLLEEAPAETRRSMMACLVIATAGEMFLSLVWGLYTYRLGNIPLFVPPGHVLLMMLGLSLARRMPDAVAIGILAAAAVYSLGAAAAGVDTLGLALLLLLGVVTFAMPSGRRLYASTFVLALALELYGTWLGNWAWAPDSPGVGLVTTNPPLAAGAFYAALDALTALACRALACRGQTPAFSFRFARRRPKGWAILPPRPAGRQYRPARLPAARDRSPG